MKELIQAISTYFAAQSASQFYVAIAGQLFLDEAPATVTGEYAVLTVPSEVPDYLFGGERFEEVLIQFNLFSVSRSAETVSNVYNYLKTLFDDCKALTVTGYTVHKFEREFAHRLRDPEQNRWEYAVQYRVQLEAS